ncbi:MAG: hypothetical protein U1D55_15180 [Phycisphaerae bacterium]
MSEDTIRCECPKCGAKYRLPLEAAGRTARCKKCGDAFAVPKLDKSLEDSVMDWLMESDPEEAVDSPRVINMPASTPADPEALKRSRGPIRMKTGAAPQK